MEAAMTAALYNTIRHVVGEHGGSDNLANELYDRIGDDFHDAVGQQVRESYAIDEDPPRKLGHTELEASMRWCPLARQVTPVGKGKKDAQIGNRYLDADGADYANPAGCRCTGSYCMSWRWLDSLRGNCGLAGRPHFQPINEPRRLPNRTPLPRPTASEQFDLFDDREAS
jgi:hypothetical protein